MSVVRITIKKHLTAGAYSRYHAAPGFFTSEYLVRSKAEFPSSVLQGYAWNLAGAESRLYHSCVRFEEAVVWTICRPSGPGLQLTLRTPIATSSIVRTHAGLSFAFDPFACARDAARELLRANPDLIARDVVAKVLAETGGTISPASISRLRSQLKRNGSYMGEGCV